MLSATNGNDWNTKIKGRSHDKQYLFEAIAEEMLKRFGASQTGEWQEKDGWCVTGRYALPSVHYICEFVNGLTKYTVLFSGRTGLFKIMQGREQKAILPTRI